MSTLDDFLGMTDVSQIRDTIKVKVNGKEYELTVRALSEEEHNEFQKRCQTYSKNKVSFDSKKYNDLLLSACIVEPNFNNAEFLKKVNCVDAMAFLNKKFPAGVLTDIASAIQEISGFESFDVEIDNAKN